MNGFQDVSMEEMDQVVGGNWLGTAWGYVKDIFKAGVTAGVVKLVEYGIEHLLHNGSQTGSAPRPT